MSGEAQYGPVADRYARQYGIPAPLYRSLITHESGWNPDAVSPAGARGLVQFMPGTARGLGINPAVPEQSLRGGAQYLRQQYDRFRDWGLALAAYNAGPNAVARAGGVPPYAETQAYVRNVLGGRAYPAPGAAPTRPQAPPAAAGFNQAPASYPAPEISPAGRRILNGYLQRSREAVLRGDEPGTRDFGLERVLAQIARLPVRGTPEPPDPGVYNPAGALTPAPTAADVRGPVGRLVGVDGPVIGRPYAGTHNLGNWQSDNAIDIGIQEGTPIYAAAAGSVGSRFGSLGSSNPRMAGLRLNLETPGPDFYYAHLSRFAPGIRPGVAVRRGQLLGYSGSANGVGHLHFAVSAGDPGSYYR